MGYREFETQVTGPTDYEVTSPLLHLLMGHFAKVRYGRLQVLLGLSHGRRGLLELGNAQRLETQTLGKHGKAWHKAAASKRRPHNTPPTMIDHPKTMPWLVLELEHTLELVGWSHYEHARTYKTHMA